MNREIRKKRLRLKKNLKTMIRITITSILLVLSIFIIVNSLNIKVSDSKTVMSYTTNSNLDYRVHLKNNNYFTAEYLPKDQQYIASIIDAINAKFVYSFSSDKNFNYTYKYKVIGTIIANHQIDSSTEKEVWNKDYTLLQEKKKEKKKSSYFDISEEVDIDYSEFSKYIAEFKKDYTLAINSVLKVVMTVDINGDINGKPVKKTENIEMDIPLSEQTFAISTVYNKTTADKVIGEVVVDTANNNYITMFGILLLTISLLMVVIDVRKILKFEHKNDKYIKTLNKMLGSYDDVIVSSKEKIDISKYNVIEVSSFNEIVDAQQELRIPIIYREVKENIESWFLIIDNKQAWLYRYVNEQDKEEL